MKPVEIEQLLEELVTLREKVKILSKREADYILHDKELSAKDFAIASSAQAIVLFGLSGKIIYANAAFLRFWGYTTAEEIFDKSVSDLWLDHEKACELLTVLNQQQKWVGELKAVTRDGAVFDVQLLAHLALDNSGQPVCGMVTILDATDRKRLEELFCFSQKMEAVGRLAGGVAHDFNNILMIILNFSELVLSELEVDHPLRTEIEEIKRAGERGAALTNRLLTFSRRQPVKLQPLDSAQLLTSLLSLIRSLIGERIELILDIAKQPGLIKADSGQIEQVIINLILNACEAMPKGGRLTLCLEKEDLTNHDPKKNLLLPAGPYLVFTVSDTGCGMDEKVRGKIFEPFFTTKEAKGSGLGLATVYGIVRQNNGMIVFDSCPGAGSTFKVYLPRLDVESDTSVNVEITAEATKTAGGPTLQSAVTTATIMVAEDHGTVRKMIRQSLRTTGYTVLEAANADEALTLCKKYTLPIDLIISDIVMPGKCGVELVEELVQLYPSMKVLFISGYRGENELTSHLLSGKEAFLAKPFSAKTLLEKVHQILTSQ